MKQRDIVELAKTAARCELKNMEERRAQLLALLDEKTKRTPRHKRVAKARSMSAAARRAVSVRMKAYWAARRANER